MKRTIQEVMDSLLFPGGFSVSPMTERRLSAVMEVLQRIPEDAYNGLKEKVEEFVWFIPNEGVGAMVIPFPCTVPATENTVALAKVLYLPPAMESRDFAVVVAGVAHELAHIFLNHDSSPTSAVNAKQEKEAWCTVKKWGFEKEERAHAKFYKEYHSGKRRLLAKLRHKAKITHQVQGRKQKRNRRNRSMI